MPHTPHLTTQPLPADTVEPAGELAHRMRMVGERLLRADVYRPEWITSDITFAVDPTPFNDWYTGHEWTWFADVSGRYMNALVTLAPYLGGLPDKARAVAEIVFANQAEDGHFGPDRPLDACDRAQASGTAWMLLALPRYYECTGDERALAAARRLAEWYAAVTPYWAAREVRGRDRDKGSYALIYSNFTHCLDGLAALWRVDPNDAYVDLARQIAGLAKRFDEEPHSHHFLATVRGVLDWYLLTGAPDFLRHAETEAAAVAERGVLDTGGVPEVFTSAGTDEGCSEVDWVLINLKLFLATGEYAYLETAERALYGHMFLAQCPNGGFGHWCGFHSDVGAMPAGAIGRFREAYWCCSMHGAYGLAEVLRHVFTANGARIAVNLFLDARAELATQAGTVRIAQTAEAYPERAEIRLGVPAEAPVTLDVRLPRHTPLTRATLDGETVTPPAAEADVLTLTVTPPGEHVVSLEFQACVRTEPARRPDLFGDRRSLWYGPMPLGTNAQLDKVRHTLDAETVTALAPEPRTNDASWPCDRVFSLPATDAPDLERTRDRRDIKLYPLASHAYRRLSYLNYLF